MRIPLEIERIRNTPIKLVKKSDGKVIGVFKEGVWVSDAMEVKLILKEVGNGQAKTQD
jgi:hypothetical protein